MIVSNYPITRGASHGRSFAHFCGQCARDVVVRMFRSPSSARAVVLRSTTYRVPCTSAGVLRSAAGHDHPTTFAASLGIRLQPGGTDSALLWCPAGGAVWWRTDAGSDSSGLQRPAGLRWQAVVPGRREFRHVVRYFRKMLRDGMIVVE